MAKITPIDLDHEARQSILLEEEMLASDLANLIFISVAIGFIIGFAMAMILAWWWFYG